MKNLLIFPVLLGLTTAAQALQTQPSPTLDAAAAMNASSQQGLAGSPTDAKFYAAQIPDGYTMQVGAPVPGANGEVIGSRIAQVQPAGALNNPPPLAQKDNKGLGGLGFSDFIGAGVVGGASAAFGVMAANAGWIGMGVWGAGFLFGGIGLAAGFMLTHDYPLTGAGMLLGPALAGAIMGSSIGPWGIVGGFAVGAIVGFVADKFLPGLFGGK